MFSSIIIWLNNTPEDQHYLDWDEGGGLAESSHADFKCRYLNNGYSYDSKISRLFL